MNEHALKCRFEGAGGITFSYRLEQNVKTREVKKVKQIKCAGCGYSLDIELTREEI
jgi:hypothetical protein